MMKRYTKEIKFICIAFSLLVFITFVPNALLKNWIFILFAIADFYGVWFVLKKRKIHSSILDAALIGMVILMIAAIVLSKLGF